MTEIEIEASLLLQGSPARKGFPVTYDISRAHAIEAICRLIKRHEAFRREVSDAVEQYFRDVTLTKVPMALERFIIAKPDPLVEAIKSCNYATLDMIEPGFAADLRKALAARGLEIVEKKP